VRVSVIITTHRRPVLLRRAVASVLAQTRPASEVWVVEDGATAETRDALADVAGQVEHVALPHSGLPARTRNAGVARASGDLVAFLDDDDEWLPDKLSASVPAFEDAQVVLASSNAWARRGDRVDERYLPALDLGQDHLLERLLRENHVICSSVVARRAAVLRAGGFCEDPGVRAFEDYDLWLRLCLLGRFQYDPAARVVYRDELEASLHGAERHRRGKALEQLLERLEAWLGDEPLERSRRRQALRSVHRARLRLLSGGSRRVRWRAVLRFSRCDPAGAAWFLAERAAARVGTSST
jgi:glycosyltransferase involved in cell wall biosynthesis